MMEKQLSIIIPTYNMESYLHHCLSSLITEKYNDCLEVLIINDGSKDGSSAIGHKFQEEFPEIFRVIDKENGNYGSCINRGIIESTGRYIKVLDADDSFNSGALNLFLEQLPELSSDLILTDFETVNTEGFTRQSFSRGIIPNLQMPFYDVLPSFLKRDLAMHEVTYKRSVLLRYGYHQTEGISYTDQEWVLGPLSHVNTITYLDILLYRYLVGREGQTVDPRVAAKTISHKILVAYKLIEILRACKEPSIVQYEVSHIQHYLNRLYYQSLMKYWNISNVSMLAAFDMKLEYESPILFQALDNMKTKRLPFHFIRKWRRYEYKDSWCLSVFRWLSSLTHFGI